MKKYPEYKQLDLPQINKEVLEYWKKNNIFSKSIEKRSSSKIFSFYEGPPSANGLPGIHHVISRTIKDAFCRFKTMIGFRVERNAGWDTHGLPVELSVEKDLNITKEDIGKKISVEKYNEQCRKNVMRYKSSWEDLTEKMGYWVDMRDPYITYDNKLGWKWKKKTPCKYNAATRVAEFYDGFFYFVNSARELCKIDQSTGEVTQIKK